ETFASQPHFLGNTRPKPSGPQPTELAMSVFTILNHGTGFRREKQDEMIADFGRQLNGREVRPEKADDQGELEGDYLITDGPGSGDSEANPLPGTYNVYTGQSKG